MKNGSKAHIRLVEGIIVEGIVLGHLSHANRHVLLRAGSRQLSEIKEALCSTTRPFQEQRHTSVRTDAGFLGLLAAVAKHKFSLFCGAVYDAVSSDQYMTHP